MTHKIISINRLRIAVTFLQGTFHPKHSTAICFEVSLFDISVELSPFAVKSMFWLSSEPIRLQEITYPDLVVARTAQGNESLVPKFLNKFYGGSEIADQRSSIHFSSPAEKRRKQYKAGDVTELKGK